MKFKINSQVTLLNCKSKDELNKRINSSAEYKKEYLVYEGRVFNIAYINSKFLYIYLKCDKDSLIKVLRSWVKPFRLRFRHLIPINTKKEVRDINLKKKNKFS